MKILITISPMISHFHALIPLAREIKRAGHQVLFATSNKLGHYIRKNGFCSVGAGLDLDGWKDIFISLKDQGYLKSDITRQNYLPKYLTPPMVKCLETITSDWHPDIIIRDPTELGSYIISALKDIPLCTVVWGYQFPKRDIQALWGESLSMLREQYGLPQDPGLIGLEGDLVIDFMPEYWSTSDFPASPKTQRFCCEPFNQKSRTSLRFLDGFRKLPIVLVTLGNCFSYRSEVFSQIINNLHDKDLNLVLTIGKGNNVESLGPQPKNVYITNYIPLNSILPSVDVVVSHAGFNTIYSALLYGKPMVLIPLGADQGLNAHLCDKNGVGILLSVKNLNMDSMQKSIQNLMGNVTFTHNIERFRSEHKKLPHLSLAVLALERIAQKAMLF